MIVQLGRITIKDLIEVASTKVLIRYMLKEIEHTWRVKFPDCNSDQFVIIIDLFSLKLKDLTNKQMNLVFQSLMIEMQRYYPEMLYSCYIVNAPMFFEAHFETEVCPNLSNDTKAKITVTGSSTHNDLIQNIDPSELPKLYGGNCDCEASCVYSDRGPWADLENKIDFRNRPVTEADTHHVVMEEFKMKESEEDQIDLLGDHSVADLKNALKMTMNIDDVSKVRNNTVIG